MLFYYQAFKPSKRHLNWKNIVTPVDANCLETLLRQSHYDAKETEFLVNGFKFGFPLGYEGPQDQADNSQNIPLTVGDKFELWEKMIKEVKLERFVGPFRSNPFKRYIQSPVGLVPKSGGKTRLIFHLSYDFPNGNQSINEWTPDEACSVKYNDLDHAVRNCLQLLKQSDSASQTEKEGEVVTETESGSQYQKSQGSEKEQKQKTIFYSKTDLMSTFRILPIFPGHRKFLLMRVTDPLTGKLSYFVEKCLSFGASISCSHFQRFSNCLKHLIEHRLGRTGITTNYLDDFIFLDITEEGCNKMVREFLLLCQEIKFPVSEEKTEFATPVITFLGMLLDGINHRISVPEDKRLAALHCLQ